MFYKYIKKTLYTKKKDSLHKGLQTVLRRCVVVFLGGGYRVIIIFPFLAVVPEPI